MPFPIVRSGRARAAGLSRLLLALSLCACPPAKLHTQPAPRAAATLLTPATAPAALRAPITIAPSSVSLRQALDAISRASGVRIAYTADIDQGGPVRLQAERTPAVSVLLSVLRTSGFEAVVDNETQIIVRRVVPPAPATRTGAITGRVVDAASQLPLDGVVVRVAGSTLGTTSDAAGRFLLREVPLGVQRLELRKLGYAPRIVPDLSVSTGKPAEAEVALTAIALQLQSVAVRPSYFSPRPTAANPVSTQTLAAEEIRRTPGAQEDVLNVLGTLPGVVGSNRPGRNDFVVRGGSAAENLYVVDGLELPNINHFGVQGSSAGAVSLISASLVRDVTLSAGGFGVRDGDRTSSVTRIDLREGNRDRLSGEFNLAATGVALTLEGPVTDRATLLVSGRRSYFDLLFAALGSPVVPSYSDLTIKSVWRPTAQDRISILGVGAVDRFRFTPKTAQDRYESSFVAPSQDQAFAALTWQRTLRRGVLTNTIGRSWTRFRTTQTDTTSATPEPVTLFRTFSNEPELSWRGELSVQAGSRVSFDVGGTAKHTSRASYDVFLPAPARLDAAGQGQGLQANRTLSATRLAAFAQTTIGLTDALQLALGIRADDYRFLTVATRWAPRASIIWSPDPKSSLTLSAGRYWQAPPLIWLVGDPGNPGRLKPFRADQAVLGVQHLPRPDLKLQIEGFVKRYGDFPTREFRPQATLQPSGFSDANYDIPFGLEPLSSRGTGTVYGVELLVQKKLSEVPLYGVASIGWSRSRFRGLDGIARPGTYDTPFSSSILAGWRPSPQWELSVRVRGASGLPITPFVLTGPDRGRLDFSRYNSGGRLPYILTIDTRVDRRWTVAGRQVIGYLDISNAGARNNASALFWSPSLDRPVFERPLSTPLPTFGINVQF